MKIEIEYEEIEMLRKEVLNLEEENKILTEKLALLDEKDMIDRAVKLSQDLTRKCLSKVFEKLGFEPYIGYCDFPMRNIKDGHGKYWWNSDNVEVVLGATITSKMRQAFINIQVLPVDFELNDDKLSLKDLPSKDEV